MSEDDKKSPQGFGANSAVFVALFATGAYFYAQQAPLTVLRPPPMESRIEEKFHAQDVEARLWQDPFDTVAREIKRVDPEEKRECDGASTKKAPTLPLHCRSPLVDEGETLRSGLERARIIAVTAPGASYFEDGETRRRLRYAVLSGLHLEGYEPRNEQHIGYFRPRDHAKNGLPVAVPYEWFDHEPSNSRPILLLWIDEDVLADTSDPLQSLSTLKSTLCPSTKNSECAALGYQVLGPYSSGILRQLAQSMATRPEAKAPEPTRSKRRLASLSAPAGLSAEARLDGVRFYVFGATVSDADLRLSEAPGQIFHTAARDDVLARAIASELHQRGVNPGPFEWADGGFGQQQREQYVALVSDRDTLYGRSISHAFIRELQCPRGFGEETEKCRRRAQDGPPQWIVTKTYHRGLDGMLPPTRSGVGKPKSENGEKSGSKDTSRAQEDVKALERPYGQDQFDYLRRLAASMKQKDDDLRLEGKAGITAIGVLGNDVFDKLLVLRALKPLFPGAVFFTTDYDATLAGQEDLEWTRNLIVASSYGPTVSEELQQDISPFRSTYQTSAFLAARLAVKEDDAKESRELRTQIKDGTAYPRMFEIDRRGHFIALPTKIELNRGRQQTSDEIHPKVPALYTNLSGWGTAGLVGILLLTTAVLFFFHWNEMVFPFLRTSCLGLAAITFLGAGVVARWGFFAEAATEHGLGEPIAWTQGLSVWPSIALRVIAAILACCLIFDAWRELQRNHLKARVKFFGQAPQHDGDEKTKREPPRGALAYIREMFSYRLPEIEDGNGRVLISAIWDAYVVKSAFWPSMCRISVYVTLMLMLFMFLAFIFGTPNVHGAASLEKSTPM